MELFLKYICQRLVLKMIKDMLKQIYRRLTRSLPIDTKAKIAYFRSYNKWPNINKPKTFNEKILRRMLKDKNKRYAELADKYLVREYVSKKIGAEFLIPLVYFTNEPESLLNINDWSGLVIKPNHAAGLIFISDDNPTIDSKRKIIDEAKTWLQIDYSKKCYEWHYSLIKPMILVEEKIKTNHSIPRDYKFHCFKQKDGDIKYVLQLVDGRFGEESRGYYLNSLDTLAWHHGAGKHELSEHEKKMLGKVISLNNKLLGEEFNYARIDWYVTEEQLYFGEITFTPGAGGSNEFGSKLEKIMSDWWVTE